MSLLLTWLSCAEHKRRARLVKAREAWNRDVLGLPDGIADLEKIYSRAIGYCLEALIKEL